MSGTNILRIAEQIPTEAAAYEYLEQLRWDGKPECPHCGNDDRCYFLTPKNGTDRKTRTGSDSQRRVWKCGACRKQFSVLTNTIMHGTKIPVRTWVFVIYEMCCSKNGVAAREIERKYGLTPKSAWFLTQRIREAMKRGGAVEMFRGVVVADETLIGGSETNKHVSQRVRRTTALEPERVVPGKREKRSSGGKANKAIVLSLISQETGEVRSQVIRDVTGATLRKHIAEQADLAATTLYTDELNTYQQVGRELAEHVTVNHSQDEYVRYEPTRIVTTNQAEGFFSQLKRSLDGTHHKISHDHLHRYLAEFDYRYSTRDLSDAERMARLASQVGGRRLTYKPLTSRNS